MAALFRDKAKGVAGTKSLSFCTERPWGIAVTEGAVKKPAEVMCRRGIFAFPNTGWIRVRPSKVDGYCANSFIQEAGAQGMSEGNQLLPLGL